MVSDAKDCRYAPKHMRSDRSKFVWLAVTVAILVTGCTSSSTTYSSAKEPEWLGKEQSLAVDRKMLARGMMPISIDCMMDTTVKRSIRPTYFVKIRYGPRPAKKHWRWGVGEADEMQVHANTAKREGLKRVQSRQMLDPNSGKKASCALWHN